MILLRRILSLLSVLVYLCCVTALPVNNYDLVKNQPLIREKRGFDLILGAEHEQSVGTDVSVEALLNVWKSPDENTRVDASATYNQRFGSDNVNGNARFGGKLTFHYE